MNTEYFKPSFSGHPGNYLLAIAVGLLSFFISSMAFAYTNEYYGPYVTDQQAKDACWAKKAEIDATNLSTNNCASAGGYYLIEKRISPGNTTLLTRYYYEMGNHTCAAGYSADGTGLCVENPCPDAGTAKEVAIPSRTPAELASLGPLFLTPDTVYDFGGCGYQKAALAPGEDPPLSDYYMADDGTGTERMFERVTVYATGDVSPFPTDPALKEVDGSDPDTSISESDFGSGEITSSTESVVSEPQQVLPDGTTVDQSTDTQIQTVNSGIQIETNPVSVEWSDGIIKTTTTTTITTINPDGSKLVETTQQVAYQQTDGALMIEDSGTGNRTITHNPGYSGSKSTSTTSTYDSQGTKTGSTSTTTPGSSTGTGNAESDFENGSSCEDNPGAFECQSVTVSAPDSEGTDSFWTSSYPDGLSGIWDSHFGNGQIEGMVADTGITDIGISSSSVDPDFGCMNLDFGGGMNFGSFCISVDSYVWNFIALCLMITALWTSRSLVFGG